MKSQLTTWLCLGLVGLALNACGEKPADAANDNTAVTTNTSASAPKLSDTNQKLADACAKNSEEHCKKLVENLVKECENNNAQSCVDAAVVFIQVNEQAVKDKNQQLGSQSYNYAVGALIKACDLGNKSACSSLEELSKNIYANLKNIKEQCVTNNNAESCAYIKDATKVLEQSCKAGKEVDCGYLKNL